MKCLTDNDIEELYYKSVKLPDSYFTKYKNFPTCPVKSWNYSWNSKDFPRTHAILDFRDWITKYSIYADTLGVTYEADPEIEFIPHSTKIVIPYPEYDLHTISDHYKSSFDFFLFNQTIEHLQNPFLALRSIYDTITPGGYMFTSVPTINIPHSTPFHYGGYNPMGLAILCKQAGFDIIESGQWGNLEYIEKMFKTHSWPSFTELQHNGCVTNEERNVCQCWILVRK